MLALTASLSPQKAALAQFPELAPAQPELCLPGDQPPVLCPAQPAPEVLPAPSHGHHGEVLRAPQASLDMVSWWGGGPGTVPPWWARAAALRCAGRCLPARVPRPGAASVCEDGGEGGEEAESKAGFALHGCGHPCGRELGADAWAPSVICIQEGCRHLWGIKNAAAT